MASDTPEAMADPNGGRLAAWRPWFMFMLGAVGLAHETVVMDAERPYLLAVFVALMGLPAFLPTLNGRDRK